MGQEVDIIGVTQLVTSRLCDVNALSIVNAFQRHVTSSCSVKIYRPAC
jgi:hypothetical protein